MTPGRLIFSRIGGGRGIYKATQGIPRVINVLCDRMLLGAYGRNESSVNHAMLRLAMHEVLGDDSVAAPMWRWLGLAVALLLAIWTAGWLLGKYSGGSELLTPSWMGLKLGPDAIQLSEHSPVSENANRAAVIAAS